MISDSCILELQPVHLQLAIISPRTLLKTDHVNKLGITSIMTYTTGKIINCFLSL